MKDIDEYENFLNAKLDAWSPKQRIAFAVAMAERWFPTYQKFSAAEQFGDVAALRRILEGIWGELLDRPIVAAARLRYAGQIEENIPHMDDFDDADAALAACVMLGEALDACGTPDKPREAGRTAISGFQAVIPDSTLIPKSKHASGAKPWRRMNSRNNSS